jgi:hypothetical protein
LYIKKHVSINVLLDANKLRKPLASPTQADPKTAVLSGRAVNLQIGLSLVPSKQKSVPACEEVTTTPPQEYSIKNYTGRHNKWLDLR